MREGFLRIVLAASLLVGSTGAAAAAPMRMRSEGLPPPSPALARGMPPAPLPELGAFAGVALFDHGFDFGNAGAPAPAPLLGVRVGMPLVEPLALEVHLSFARVSFADTEEVSHDGILLVGGEGLLVLGARRGPVQPFAGAGVAYHQLFGAIAGFEGDAGRPTAVLRGGLRVPLAWWGGVRVDVANHLAGGMSSAWSAELGAFVTF